MTEEDRAKAVRALLELFELINGGSGSEGNPSANRRRIILQRVGKRMLAFRAWRLHILGPIYSSEPCWDLLLAMYSAWAEGTRRSVTDLTHDTQVPSATVIRWLSALEKGHYVVREADKHDGRRSWLSLTRFGIQQVEKCLSAQAFNSSEDRGAALELG